MEVIIREATLKDLSNLAVLKQQVWISTYATDGLIQKFSDHVLSEYSTENVRKSILDKNKLTLLAISKNCLIACVEILLIPQRPVKKLEPSIEISTFYVLERFQGFGIGKKLLIECFKVIKQLKHNEVWLTVYYKNQKAIDFYQKQGFKLIGEMDFVLGEDNHKNYIMVKEIE
ncbi:MAG: GNAT family N-acetyltransferase [Bacteroidales bacterium]|nr:GNAT family N-acetyltransferase [Bacteroidales bacterium]